MAAGLNTGVKTDISYRANFQNQATVEVDGTVFAAYVPHVVATKQVLFSDLGSGATDDIAFGVTLTGVIILGGYAEVDTAFAGEADLSFALGVDSGDVDAFVQATTLHGLAAGLHGGLPGVSAGQLYSTVAPGIRLAATELDDVTVGSVTFVLIGFYPNLLT